MPVQPLRPGFIATKPAADTNTEPAAPPRSTAPVNPVRNIPAPTAVQAPEGRHVFPRLGMTQPGCSGLLLDHGVATWRSRGNIDISNIN